jgi:glycosyltransferase involved in cell wall biosynthesis
LQPIVSIIRCSNLVRTSLDDFVSEMNFNHDSIEVVFVIPQEYNCRVMDENGIKFVYDEGKGIYPAMQLGLEKATGKFVIFVNDDDSPVEAFEDILQSNGVGLATNVDLYEFNIVNLCGDRISESSFKSELKLKFGQMPTSHQGQLWSLNTLKQLGFFRRNLLLSKFLPLRIELRIAADLDLYLRAQKLGIRKVQISEALTTAKPGGYSDTHLHRRYSEVAAVLASRKRYPLASWAFFFLRFQISGLISRIRTYA